MWMVPSSRATAPGQDLDQRRLAGAVGTGDRDDLAGARLEVDTVQHLDPAVGLAHPVQSKHQVHASITMIVFS